MLLKTFRHLWGIKIPFHQAFALIKADGYDGIEYKPAGVDDISSFKQLLKEFDFQFIAQIHTAGDTVQEHIKSFKALIERSLPLEPLLINSQSGRDYWSADEKDDFMSQAIAYEAKLGIPVAHETHRGRILYNPWETRDLLLTHPGLKLCCDFSHWVCVCERLLTNEASILRLCAARCHHLHARVGYEQGPQVPDPGAPEYAHHLAEHEKWWGDVWQMQRSQGKAISTLTPEFGPPPYQQTVPFSKEPAADLWKICNWMNNRQKAKFLSSNNTEQYVTDQRNVAIPEYTTD